MFSWMTWRPSANVFIVCQTPTLVDIIGMTGVSLGTSAINKKTIFVGVNTTIFLNNISWDQLEYHADTLSVQTPTLVDHIFWTVVDRELRQCGGWHYFYTAVGDAMAVLNLSVNFVVYVLTSRRFRRGLLAALGCRQTAVRRQTELGTETACDAVIRSTAHQRGPDRTVPITSMTAPSRTRLARGHLDSVV